MSQAQLQYSISSPKPKLSKNALHSTPSASTIKTATTTKDNNNSNNRGHANHLFHHGGLIINDSSFYELALGLSPSGNRFKVPEILADSIPNSSNILNDSLLDEIDGDNDDDSIGLVTTSSPIIQNDVIKEGSEIVNDKMKLDDDEEEESGMNEFDQTRDTLSRILNDESIESSDNEFDAEDGRTVNLLDQLDMKTGDDYGLDIAGNEHRKRENGNNNDNNNLHVIQRQLIELQKWNKLNIFEIESLIDEVKQFKSGNEDKIINGDYNKERRMSRFNIDNNEQSPNFGSIHSSNKYVNDLITSTYELLNYKFENEENPIKLMNNELKLNSNELLRSLNQVSKVFQT